MVTDANKVERTCSVCGGKNFTHYVWCKNFVCPSCGKKGQQPDHERGCPDSEMLWGVPDMQVQPKG